MERIQQQLIPRRTLSDGTTIPSIGLGTFGSDKYGAEAVAQAVYGAILTGYRLIDCASVYQNEAQIGTSIARACRDGGISRQELFVTSKVWNDRHGPGMVAKSCEQSLSDLGLDIIDLYFVHWPFPNYHAPGCDGDSRNPDSRPFQAEEFLEVWRQCEDLVRTGKVRRIGMSNMTVKKLREILPQCQIRPAALEMELHPSFQQPALFQYAISQGIQPIGYCPIGSPSRPERDRTSLDVADTQLPTLAEIARRHNVHPALICLKWAVQRGQIPIPFSVKPEQYTANLRCVTQDPLTPAEMAVLAAADCNCRLIKGQVFLWPGAKSWEELWDGEA